MTNRSVRKIMRKPLNDITDEDLDNLERIAEEDKDYRHLKHFTRQIKNSRKMMPIIKRIDAKYLQKGRSGLNEPEKVWYDVLLFRLMVDNGGFLHYFHVSRGQNIRWLLDSLMKVGAHKTYAEVICLCLAFPEGWPSSGEKKRERQIDELIEKARGGDESDESLDIDLDDEIFKLPVGFKNYEDLEALLLKYWHAYHKPEARQVKNPAKGKSVKKPNSTKVSRRSRRSAKESP